MKHEAAVRMLISFFNMQTGRYCKVVDHGDKIDALINDEENNVREIKEGIKE